jgi:hypothetical protein|tara:strand:- start:242 stop:460 length:219 start_codon:yes stop_codon:yes gene_type:complete
MGNTRGDIMTITTQKAIDKYQEKIDTFIAKTEQEVKKDKVFKNIKGNVFAAMLLNVKKDINSYLNSNKIRGI